MNKITPEDINAFIAEADLSASNKAKVYKFLKILFGAARKNNLILENPMDIAIVRNMNRNTMNHLHRKK